MLFSYSSLTWQKWPVSDSKFKILITSHFGGVGLLIPKSFSIEREPILASRSIEFQPTEVTKEDGRRPSLVELPPMAWSKVATDGSGAADPLPRLEKECLEVMISNWS